MCALTERRQDQPQVCLKLGVSGLDVGERIVVPNVVDADHDRHDIRLDINKITLQAADQISGTVSADAEIDKFKPGIRIAVLNHSRRIPRVPFPHIVGVRSVPSGVGHAVTLKQNLHGACLFPSLSLFAFLFLRFLYGSFCRSAALTEPARRTPCRMRRRRCIHRCRCAWRERSSG